MPRYHRKSPGGSSISYNHGIQQTGASLSRMSWNNWTAPRQSQLTPDFLWFDQPTIVHITPHFCSPRKWSKPSKRVLRVGGGFQKFNKSSKKQKKGRRKKKRKPQTSLFGSEPNESPEFHEESHTFCFLLPVLPKALSLELLLPGTSAPGACRKLGSFQNSAQLRRTHVDVFSYLKGRVRQVFVVSKPGYNLVTRLVTMLSG